MNTLLAPQVRPLTRRLMASFSRWKDLDSWGRTRMPGLSDREREALADLEHNFQRAGSQARWFTGDEVLKPGVLTFLLDGFTLTDEAIPDLVRCARVDGPARKASLERALRQWLKDGPERLESLSNQTPPAPLREALQAPAAVEGDACPPRLIDPVFVPREAPEAVEAGTEPEEVVDLSATPTLADQSKADLPANGSTADPFETEAEPVSLTLENLPMPVTANSNGIVSNGRLPHLETQEQYGHELISKPGRAGVKEQVEELIKKRGIDLEQSISQEIREEFSTKTGASVRTVRWAIEELRKERGIEMRGRTVATAPGRSINDLVLTELKRMGFTLEDELPRGTVLAIADRLNIKQTAAQAALTRLRAQERKADAPAPSAPGTPAGSGRAGGV